MAEAEERKREYEANFVKFGKGLQESQGSALKDDVMGVFVTTSNADAELSSLMHHPRNEEVSGSVAVNGGVNNILALLGSKEQVQMTVVSVKNSRRVLIPLPL